MSHTCKSLILHCIDFRFGEAIKKYLEDNRLMNNCDIVSLAGAVKNLVSPINPSYVEMVLRQIEISQKLHHITQVILMNHTDCGAYGGHNAFESTGAEYTQHVEDMKKAKKIIADKFSGLEIKMVLAKITPLGQVAFEEVW
ncbi:MAG: carbonic anhydrase [Patescibacteria group bacterium]